MDGIVLIINLITGLICAAIASGKGRSAIGWFILGFIFPVFGVIVAFIVSDLKEQARYRSHSKGERRRLQEQLRQERMKNEAFRRHTAGRLDAHDRTLGVNTRSSAELIGGGRTAPPQLETGTAISSAADRPADSYETTPPPRAPGIAWFYLRGDEQKGPVDADRLTSAFRTGRLPLTTLVWCDGMAAWAPAADVPAFGRSAR